MASVELPARAHIEARLDEIVAENRFTIAVVFPTIGAITLLASAVALLPEPLRFNPYFLLFGVVVMRLPLIAGVAPTIDRRAALGIVGLVVYTYAIEFLGVFTGFPYGQFSYGIDLGPMIAGHVPVALPLFFLPLVVNAYLLYLLVFGAAASRALRLSVVVAAVVGMDLVLDPGAVALGFWVYDAGGAYYGVPWTNYAGWVLSSSVSVVVLDYVLDREGLLARLESCRFMLDDLVSFVILWGVINVAFGNLLPAALSVVYGYVLWRTDRFDFPER